MIGELIPTGYTYNSGRIVLNDAFSGEVSFNGFSAETIYSGSTNLYDIFLTTSEGGDITRVSSGTNIITGGTVSNPTISVTDDVTLAGEFSSTTLTVGSRLGVTSANSVALGFECTATGLNSFAQGYQSVANAKHTFAVGFLASATSDSSIAMGNKSWASEKYAIALGYENVATGPVSTTIGGEINLNESPYSLIAGGGNNTINSSSDSSSIISSSGSSIIGGSVHSHIWGSSYLPSTIDGGSFSVIIGPDNKISSSSGSFIFGGLSEILDSNGAIVLGTACSVSGSPRSIAATRSTIVNGRLNVAFADSEIHNASYSFTLGDNVIISGESSGSEIVGVHASGENVKAYGNYAFVHGKGESSWPLIASGANSINISKATDAISHGAFGDSSVILGGIDHINYADYSTMLGGLVNTVLSTATGSTVLGLENFIATQPNTVYGDNFSVQNSISATTFYSGSTELGTLFGSGGSGTVTNIQNGLNTYTGGTAIAPVINISAATLDNLTVTGVTDFNKSFHTATYTGAGTATWDYNNGSNAEITLTADTTLTITNAVDGDYGTIIVIQDTTGGWNLTPWVGATHKVVTDGGGVFTLTPLADAEDILSFVNRGASTFYWNVGYNYN